MSLATLAELATYPGTLDKDRYARTVRREIRGATNHPDLDAGVHLVLNGLLRLVDRRDPIAENQQRLCAALDVLASVTGVGWRRDVLVHIDGDEVLRKGSLFSNPTVGQQLVDIGVIMDFDPSRCTCSTLPEAICFAATHTV